MRNSFSFFRFGFLWLCYGLIIPSVFATNYPAITTFEGTGWRMSFNTPSQSAALHTLAAVPSALTIPDRWVQRFNELGPGDYGSMSTYGISAFAATNGFTSSAGRILFAISNALSRGASVGFVSGDAASYITNTFDVGFSFDTLKSQYPSRFSFNFIDVAGIMHHKMGTFIYSNQEPWSVSGSWNIGDASCSQQWNVFAEVQSRDLSRAVSNELAQLLAGIHHTNTAKVNFDTTFPMQGAWTNGIVRFAPQIHASTNNTALEVIKIIDQAQKEIYFGINILNVNEIGDALVRAANRGVIIRGVLNKHNRSDAESEYTKLIASTNYTSDNKVQIFDAYMKGNRTVSGTNLYDNSNAFRHLVHAKYMVVDPWGSRPWVISGSANWTDAAMISRPDSSANDENCFFMPHAGVAQAFTEQFLAMANGLDVQFDTYDGLSLVRATNGNVDVQVAGYTPGNRPFNVYVATNLVKSSNDWRVVAHIVPSLASGTNFIGRFAVSNGVDAVFYKVVNPPAPKDMVLIPAGAFVMGDAMGDGNSAELPLNTKSIDSFYIDKYEVTKEMWEEVQAWAITNGYFFGTGWSGKSTNHPVNGVDWFDSIAWCNARSVREGLKPCYTNTNGSVYTNAVDNSFSGGCNWSANGYRLPTEAEWEKAARGGVANQRFPWGNIISHDYANYSGYWGLGSTYYNYGLSVPSVGTHPTFSINDPPFTSPVGYFAPNKYGLYDVAGNVSEWCWDWYDPSYYSNSPASNPRGPSAGLFGTRVLRGGSWDYDANDARVASRGSFNPEDGSFFHPEGGRLVTTGFRCVRGY